MQAGTVAGLDYDQARWYSPLLGQFITKAPTGISSGDPNLYRYAGNEPVDMIDPSGLQISIVFRPVPTNTLPPSDPNDPDYPLFPPPPNMMFKIPNETIYALLPVECREWDYFWGINNLDPPSGDNLWGRWPDREPPERFGPRDPIPSDPDGTIGGHIGIIIPIPRPR